MILRQILRKGPIKGHCKFSPKFRLVPQILLVYCASDVSKNSEISPQALTHEFLLKQSSGIAASAVAQLLHYTVAAYVDIANNYMKMLNKQISLTEEFLSRIGDTSAEEKLSDSIIGCRIETKELKEKFSNLESLMVYIEELVNSTTQASFLAGADYYSLSLCEQLNAAKREIQTTKKSVETTEQDYLSVELQAIEKERKKKDKGGNIFSK
ncbi:diablo IAP-binding mitochondrial protein isoform X2 [Halyomorpha halys]|uniref:diablo IAP-binding mitochondrial protein isoform X2 n=1 Tax=Halyomorpha halys TaxID=286706 RepID=UPI0006D4F0AA|nr:diablo homolog, mitochondrial-like isoform X2 [Halyomorpha halys]